jgi:hypothetical protein
VAAPGAGPLPRATGQRVPIGLRAGAEACPAGRRCVRGEGDRRMARGVAVARFGSGPGRGSPLRRTLTQGRRRSVPRGHAPGHSRLSTRHARE